MGKKQQESNERQNFLRTFFSKKGYEEKEVNGYWLVKQGGNTEIVAIYTKERYTAYKKYQDRMKQEKIIAEAQRFYREDARIRKMIEEKAV
jgi:hypothetical protein